MNTSIRSLLRAALVLAPLALLPGCGDDGGFEPLIIPSDNDPGAAQRPQVTFNVTNGAGVTGSFVVTLLPEYAPATVANFLAYVNTDFYDNTIIHRHEAGFVLQGGGYAAPLAANDTPQHKGTNPPIALELKVSNVLGTVGMARGSAPNSATSEFFINLDNNDFLDSTSNGGGYAAFGYITDFTTVNAMTQATCVSAVITSGTTYGCLPVPNLVITSATQTR